MEYNDLILVTWDFTDKSYIALEHAINIAKNIRHDIAIIHVVKKESEVSLAKKQIADAVKKYFENISVKPQIFVKEGTIFTTIAEMAEEIKARMVVMPTHGIKGMQKLLGSWALKVIAGSKAPFIVVQDKPKTEDIFRNILLPVSFKKENKESINWATFFSKNFGTKFHILYAKYNDTNFIKGVESNLIFINKYFSQKNIRHESISASGTKEFHQEVIEHAAKINADSIMVMTTRDIGIADYMLGAQEQYIIANQEKIPVICINPRPAKIGGGFSASGG